MYCDSWGTNSVILQTLLIGIIATGLYTVYRKMCTKVHVYSAVQHWQQAIIIFMKKGLITYYKNILSSSPYRRLDYRDPLENCLAKTQFN